MRATFCPGLTPKKTMLLAGSRRLVTRAVGFAPNRHATACAAGVLMAMNCVLALNALDCAYDALVVTVWSASPGSAPACRYLA